LTVWNQLRAVKLKFGLPWIVMGDFNEVMNPKERKGLQG